MPKNHAKAIKGMSIACIALSGVVILAAIALMFVLGFLDTIMADVYADPYYGGYDMSDYYDSIFGAYGLGSSAVGLDGTHGVHHGASAYGYYSDYYDDYASYKLAAMVANVMLVCGIIGAGITLAAGIIALRNYNKPEKFNLAFGWSIVGAVFGFLTTGVIQGVLFIIIAVFINSDKKLYQAGMYFVPAPGVAPGYPMQQPMVPGAPIAPMASGAPGAPVAPAAAAPAQPVQPVAEPATQVTTAEVYQPVGQPAFVPGETQPPAPAEAATPAADPAAPTDGAVETVQAEAIVTEAPAETPAEAPAEAAVEVPAEAPAPVVVDEGAVIKLDISGEQPPEQ